MPSDDALLSLEGLLGLVAQAADGWSLALQMGLVDEPSRHAYMEAPRDWQSGQAQWTEQSCFPGAARLFRKDGRVPGAPRVKPLWTSWVARPRTTFLPLWRPPRATFVQTQCQDFAATAKGCSHQSEA